MCIRDRTNPSCGQDDGSITFTFPDNPERTGLEFSLDGGSTWSALQVDNVGSRTFPDLAAGTYDLAIRWGDGTCPTSLGTVELNTEYASLTICNDGNCSIDLSPLQPAGDNLLTTIQPGTCFDLSAAQGQIYLATNENLSLIHI